MRSESARRDQRTLGATPSSSRGIGNMRIRFFQWDTLACINCSNSAPENNETSPKLSSASEKSVTTNPVRRGPLLVELRRLQFDSGSVASSSNPSLFPTHSLCQARGNPSLGSSVASTCLSVASEMESTELPLVATGLSTGALCIHKFSNDDASWKASTEYYHYHVPRAQRLATAVEWRPNQTQQVAIGLTAGGGPSELRHQTQQGLRLAVAGTGVSARASHPGDRDYCCFLWDVEHQSSARRTKPAPISRLAHQAGVASLGWLLDGGQVLVLGTQNRNLQVYDLRMHGENNSPPLSVYAHNFAVHGVRTDPSRPWQFATFSKAAGEAVKLWDARRLDTGPTSEIKLQSLSASTPVVEVVKWLPSGVLSVLAGDGNMYLYDTSGSRPLCSNTLFTNGQIEDVAHFQGADGPENPTTRPFQQFLSKRLVVIRRDQSIQDIPLHRTAPLTMSHRPVQVIRACGRSLLINSLNIDVEGDIATTILRRTGTKKKSSMRYSMNVDQNIALLSKEVKTNEDESVRVKRNELIRLWRWIQRVERIANEVDETESLLCKNLIGAGAIQLLGSDRDESETKTISEFTRCDVYESKARSLALTSCGWAGELELGIVMTRCEEVGEYERSAALAVWHGNIAAAVEALERGPNDLTDTSRCEAMSLVSLSIAGYNGRDSASGIWIKACKNLLLRPELIADTSESCYLRHALLFLMTETKHQDIIEDPKLCLCDRVAFACRYLPFERLSTYLRTLVDECTISGNIEGVSITGLDKRGIKIVQSYVDATADVQTAAVLTSRALLPTDWIAERKVVAEWLQEYRILLNRWQLWQCRAMFDVDRADLVRKIKARQEIGLQNSKRRINKGQRQGMRKPDPDIHAPIRAQLEARCNYCNAPLALRRQESRAWQSKMKGVLTFCPNCKKPLPKCSICMLPLEALNPFVQLTKGGGEHDSLDNLPFAEWFTWCMRCKHGGHAHHLMKWFETHKVCPVSGCDCRCQFDSYEEGTGFN